MSGVVLEVFPSLGVRMLRVLFVGSKSLFYLVVESEFDSILIAHNDRRARTSSLQVLDVLLRQRLRSPHSGRPGLVGRALVGRALDVVLWPVVAF